MRRNDRESESIYRTAPLVMAAARSARTMPTNHERNPVNGTRRCECGAGMPCLICNTEDPPELPPDFTITIDEKDHGNDDRRTVRDRGRRHAAQLP